MNKHKFWTVKTFKFVLLPCLPLFLAQTPTPQPTPQEILKPQQVLPLPGGLNQIPTFNSNSPEVVLNEGILLSTFPSKGMKSPNAHLNFPFNGRFDIFAHHIAKAEPANNLRTLYLGILLSNPTSQPVTIEILQGASYLSQPDAPFIELPSVVENPRGNVYSGPGSRVMSDVLRGQRQVGIPATITLPPKGSQMVLNAPIPVRSLQPPLNGRSTLLRLRSNGTVYAASLALFAKENPDGSERAPSLAAWQEVLRNGSLVTPRDRTPTPPERTGGIIYGRVAGVAQGTEWQAQIANNNSRTDLNIPQPGQAYSYGISTLIGGKLGINQVQSAPMLVRYPDTAYQAHGNYGIEYDLNLPLYNQTNQTQTVTLSLQTPIKEDKLSRSGLRFFDPLPRQVFFRGTVRIRYNDDNGIPQTRYVHLVQRRGQMGEPLATLKMPQATRRLVQVDFLYPPDATPPQVLTISTLSP